MYLADRSAPAPEGAKTAAERGPVRAPAVASTVLALGAVSMITDISSEMVTAVLPLYLIAGLGLSPLGFGALDGVYNGVSALVQLTGGHLADRVRNHKLIAGIGYGLSALCKPLLLFAHSLGPISVILTLERTGKGLRTAPRDALISLSTPPELQGRAFGVHRAMDTTGALLGPLAAFFILSLTVDGYDAVFGVSACVAVLGVVVLMLFVPSGGDIRPGPSGGAPAKAPATAPAKATAKAPAAAPATAEAAAVPGADRPAPVRLRDALGLLRLPRLRNLAVCAVLLGLTTVSDAFVYLLLQRRTGIGDQWFPLMPLGTAAVFLLLAVPAGALADRIGRRTVFLVGHALLLAGYGLLLWAPAWPALPYLVLALHGMFYAATDGVLPAAVAATVPGELRATGMALVGTGQALARFGCSLAFGAAWTLWGTGPALAAAAVGLLCCAAVAGFVLRPAAPRDTGPEPDPDLDPDPDPNPKSNPKPVRPPR
ncbi:MFS transporter [Streptomyces sp. NBC_01214]|uniref:MFS transporter n=1 Tax=Streptomyces sp. NBC_01214 TaxID=2903777 RepID=UPI002259936D|nr:MFS transporter [Streptomyces sp. NBC_01214]MCX4806598.1 MFS transporter [Streptomyces sp. NBC_01214]